LRDIFGLTDAELGFATQPAATGRTILPRQTSSYPLGSPLRRG